MITSKLEMNVKTVTGMSVSIGSEGDISIRENGAVVRVLTAEQARDLAHALEQLVKHSEGRLIGDGA